MTEVERPRDTIDMLLLIASFGVIALGALAVCGLLFLLLITIPYGGAEEALFIPSTVLSFAAMSLCAFPVAYLSIRALSGQPPPHSTPPSTIWLGLIVLFPLLLFLGDQVFSRDVLPGLLGSLIHVTAAVIPIIFVVVLARRRGPTLSRRRVWGQFMLGVWIIPIIALTIETVLLIGFVLSLMIGLQEPALGQILSEAASNPEVFATRATTDDLLPILQNPWVITLALGFIILLVPLLEEGIKSLAIWPLLRRKLTPLESFLSGVFAGLGFAFVEALLLTQPGSYWVETMFARGGATMMHAFTAGLTCWGIGQVSSERRWKRAIGAYMLAVLMHGVWNAAAIGMAVGDLPGEVSSTPISPEFLQSFSQGSSLLLVILAIIALAGIAFTPILLKESEKALQET
jgi:RsiW-degrading membrane proteinase PrsW (M82 family)